MGNLETQPCSSRDSGQSAVPKCSSAPLILPAALLFLLGIAAFGGTLRNDFTTWDDDVYVTRNPDVRDLSLGGIARLFTSFANCNYHPLTDLTYRFEYAMVGLNPWLYHLDNVLLHSAATVLAFFLLRRWLGSPWVAFLASALFLLHTLVLYSPRR